MKPWRNGGRIWPSFGGPPKAEGRAGRRERPPNGEPPFSGFTYFQTISSFGVTSKTVPFVPEQMSVSPLGRRWAPEMNGA